ncbi:MAG: FBP domain-containing protein, partial [Actinobacteria bacterium]|nr:FBP domain-containing protein [Actinomycetota bacterium]
VGTLICRDFECSQNVRNDPPPAYDGYDVAAAREHRIDNLRLKVAGFADMLLTGR